MLCLHSPSFWWHFGLR